MPALAKGNPFVMKIVVITGSTKGIGFGLAESFLYLGCSVVINGRSTSTVEDAMEALSSRFDPQRICGFPCDVTDLDQVRALWGKAKDHYGEIDYWINNAGMSPPQSKFWEHEPEEILSVVDLNLMGSMNGCAVAIPEMLDQGYGCVYNMEGLGSDGRQIEGSILYGCTKYAVAYLTKGLAKETEGTPIIVGSLSPGMVVTDLLVGEYDKESAEWERVKPLFNILADRVETVTPWLAERVLMNTKNGAQIAWLTKKKIAWRFLSSPFHKRDLFSN